MSKVSNVDSKNYFIIVAGILIFILTNFLFNDQGKYSRWLPYFSILFPLAIGSKEILNSIMLKNGFTVKKIFYFCLNNQSLLLTFFTLATIIFLAFKYFLYTYIYYKNLGMTGSFSIVFIIILLVSYAGTIGKMLSPKGATWIGIASIFNFLKVELINLVKSLKDGLRIESNSRLNIYTENFIFAALTAVYISTFYNFRNLLRIVEIIHDNLLAGSFFFIFLALIIRYLISEKKTADLTKRSSKAIIILSLIAAFVIILLLSFRTDSLTITLSSDFHWNYYYGVIRSIKSGGLLLWDTLSQYGYLNLIIPSLMPFNPIQSLYIFQSLLLLFISFLCFIIVYKKSTHSMGSRFLISLIISCIFFFADPELIGPQPYPSSSVMRFFPSFLVYLLYYFYKSSHLESSNKNRISSIFQSIVLHSFIIISFIWSAESFLYTLVIIFTHMISCIIYANLNEKKSDLLKRELIFIFHIFINIILLIALKFLFYKFKYGVHFNFSLYFIHAKEYANGFGSYSLDRYGAFWIAGIPLLTQISVLLSCFREGKFNTNAVKLSISSGVVYGWLSYYIGRSVPDNIIAMSPLLLMSFWLSLKDISAIYPDSEIYYFFKRMLNIFIIIIVGSIFIQKKFITVASNLKTFTSDLSMDKMPADKNLTALIAEYCIAYPNMIPYAYYSMTGGLPQIIGKKLCLIRDQAWLPEPLSLMEQPINPDLSRKIFDRWQARIDRDGLFIINKNYNISERIIMWKEILNNYYDCGVHLENSNYEIMQCKTRKL